MAQMAPLAGREMTALLELRDGGLLMDADPPGGPGAGLIFGGARREIEEALQGVPLVRQDLVDTAVIDFRPFPMF